MAGLPIRHPPALEMWVLLFAYLLAFNHIAASSHQGIPDLSQPLTEVAADCEDAIQVANRRIRVDLSSTRSQAIEEEQGQFYILQLQDIVEVQLQRLIVTVVTDLEFCGNADHQTKAQPTIVESVPLSQHHFQQIDDEKKLSYEIVRFGPGHFANVTFDIDRTMAPTTIFTAGLKGSWYTAKGYNQVYCDGATFDVWGQGIPNITPYASITVEAKDEVGVLNVTSSVVSMHVGDHLEPVCTMNATEDFCGAFVPTKGNYLAQRIGKHEDCLLKRTTFMPITGSVILLPETGKRVLYMPEQAVHFTLLEEETYDETCKVPVMRTKDYDFFVANVSHLLFNDPPQQINSHNFEVKQALNLKLDYINYFEAVREQRMAQLINQELRQQKKRLNEDFLELLATASGNRLTRRGSNETHALFLRMNGNIMREIVCPLKRYPLADTSHCCDELAIMDKGRVRYVSYPEGVVGDNYTLSSCDPSLCETYELTSGIVVSQCPTSVLANGTELLSIQMNGTSLDNYVALIENSTFQSRSAYGHYTGRPTYRKLMLDYEDRSSLSHSRNFWPSFFTNGRIDGNKPFDFARSMASSPLGPLGAVMGFFAGGLQELLLFAALAFAAYLIIKRMRTRGNRVPINMNVNMPSGNNR